MKPRCTIFSMAVVAGVGFFLTSLLSPARYSTLPTHPDQNEQAEDTPPPRGRLSLLPTLV